MKTTAMAFKASWREDDQDFMFHYKLPNVDLLDTGIASQARITQTKIRRVNSASELHAALAGSVCSIMEFYTDYARRADDISRFVYGLANMQLIASSPSFGAMQTTCGR